MFEHLISYNKCSKILNTFFLSSQIICWLIIRAGIDKILVRIANREDPDQTASESLIWVFAVCLAPFFAGN